MYWDLHANPFDLGQAKSSLISQPDRTLWAIQLKFCARAAPFDRMNMRWRMVIGIDRHADVSDRQDGRNGAR